MLSSLQLNVCACESPSEDEVDMRFLLAQFAAIVTIRRPSCLLLLMAELTLVFVNESEIANVRGKALKLTGLQILDLFRMGFHSARQNPCS